MENNTFNNFPNVKLTNFISFTSFCPNNLLMLKNVKFKKNKIDNLSDRSLKFNSINKFK